jgi:hypothetical protein
MELVLHVLIASEFSNVERGIIKWGVALETKLKVNFAEIDASNNKSMI